MKFDTRLGYDWKTGVDGITVMISVAARFANTEQYRARLISIVKAVKRCNDTNRPEMHKAGSRGTTVNNWVTQINPVVFQ